MQLLLAFLTRDYLTQTSYRTAFLFSFVGIFFRAFIFFFIAQLIGPGASPYLDEVGGDYFPFVLLGLAFNSYFGIGLNAFANSIRQAQMTGTLEAMLMTPTPVGLIVIGSAGWSYLFTTLQVVVYFLIGIALGIDISGASWGIALICLVLAIIAFAAIGIIAASLIMVIKRGDPITSLIGSLSALFGGVYYPIEILPQPLQLVSHLLPVTYALRVIRQALLVGTTFQGVAGDLGILLLFCIVLVPISLMIFRFAVNRARTEGTLAQY
ncbi:MAG: ABC transporter permease [Chloroflexota bacterium]